MAEKMNKQKGKKDSNRIKGFLNKDQLRALFPMFGLVLIVVVFAWLTDMRLVKMRSINLILSQVYVPMIACSGVFLVMTIGGLDLSQGSMMGMSSIIVSYLSFYSIPLAVVAGIVAGGIMGAINGVFHVKFKIPSFIVTICTMYLFRGLCAYLTTQSPVAAVKNITDLNEAWFKIVLTIAVLVTIFFLYHFTRIGVALKAIGAGETAARFSGIRTDRTKFFVFVAAGAITGFAAFINVIKVGSITATSGNQLEIQVLIALVLGGLPISGGAKSKFASVIIGTLIYSVLNNGLVMLGLDSAVQQLIKGVIFVIVVAVTIDRKEMKVIK